MNENTDKEQEFDKALRPLSFSDFIGQDSIVKNLKIFVEACNQREDALDHTLFHGPPGLGKTTLAHALLRLIPSQGKIFYDNERIDNLTRSQMRPLRRLMQIVFQDPYGSLSPRLSVGQIVEEGLILHCILKESKLNDIYKNEIK